VDAERSEFDQKLCETAKEKMMTWTTPDFEEISLGCEINSYATAEL
jgi:coenzyme PQQ precursor peptide PqqA